MKKEDISVGVLVGPVLKVTFNRIPFLFLRRKHLKEGRRVVPVKLKQTSFEVGDNGLVYICVDCICFVLNVFFNIKYISRNGLVKSVH